MYISRTIEARMVRLLYTGTEVIIIIVTIIITNKHISIAP